MAYSKVFNRVNWENEPSLNTPLNENNLNKGDYALNEIDNRVVEMSVQMDNLNGYETRAAQSATNADASATASANSATQSQGYAQQSAAAAATAAEDTAEDLEQAMAGYVSDAQGYATQSQSHASDSQGYANDSADSAVDAEAWANGQRHGIDVQSTDETYHNNAKYWQERANYWYLQAQLIAESFSGALRPMGTVTFANLPDVSVASAGDMYNVSDEFTTTSDFVEGAGIVVPLGSNVYLTNAGKWDVLAGSPVTGIKGNAENVYRKGNVNITKANIGLGNVDNESLGSADISAIGDGSVKGAITQINTSLSKTSVVIPTPTVDGNKRTYTINGLSSKKYLDITIGIQAYGMLDTRIISVLSGLMYNVYAVDINNYTWSGRVSILNDTISVETSSNSTNPATNYLKLQILNTIG